MGATDYETLAANLSALAYAIRLEILDRLRVPHTLSQIEVEPARGHTGPRASSASRQTVRHHLDKLLEADLVRAEAVEQGGRTVQQYTVHPQRLYALTEEMRTLSVNRVHYGSADDATGTIEGAARAPPVSGPRLALAHGVLEGKMFPLSAPDDAGWTIGRRRGVAVELAYDPFVSLEHAAVRRHGDDYVLHDLGSKNGTTLNWTPLPPKGEAPLKPGYVIGVGRSLLCFVID